MNCKKERFLFKEYAAPMVKASTLPFREECLRYGASFAFTEELIDRKVIGSYRTECADGTVLFLTKKDNSRTVHFNPRRAQETIAQLGTADGVLALQASEVLLNYVSEININMGCPKSFSVSGGMGAALLSKPEEAAAIVKTLKSQLPSNIPVTCKIRYIGDKSDKNGLLKQTAEFMEGLARSGADAITVHMRTVPMRPREPAVWPTFVDLVKSLSAQLDNVPIIANGDFFDRSQISLFRDSVNEGLQGSGRSWSDSVMIARGAMWNPSIFSKDDSHTPASVLRDFIECCQELEEPFVSIKWILGQMMDGHSEIGGLPVKKIREVIHRSHSLKELREELGFLFDEETVKKTRFSTH